MNSRESFLQGQRYFLQGNYSHSIIFFGKALEMGMEPTRVHLPLGMAYLKNGNFFAAASEFGHALEADPVNDRCLFLRGMALLNDGEPDKALPDFTEALHLNPRRTPARIGRSLALWALHRDGDAEEELKKVVLSGGLEVELFLREYCQSPHVYALALHLFDLHKATWGPGLRAERLKTIQ